MGPRPTTKIPPASPVLRAVLAGLVSVACVDAITPNQASAQTACPPNLGWETFFSVNPAGYSCDALDKRFSTTQVIGDQAQVTGGPTNIYFPNVDTSTFELTGSVTALPPPGFAGDIFQVQAQFAQPFLASGTPDFSAPFSNASTTGKYFYEYTVTITDPNFVFAGIQQDSDVLPGLTTSIWKEVWFGGVADATPDLTLKSIDGAADPVVVFDTSVGNSPVTKLLVRDTIVTPGNGVTSITNKFIQKEVSKVPGPLGIFGAAAAFGYSRKLRTRMKMFTTH